MSLQIAGAGSRIDRCPLCSERMGSSLIIVAGGQRLARLLEEQLSRFEQRRLMHMGPGISRSVHRLAGVTHFLHRRRRRAGNETDDDED